MDLIRYDILFMCFNLYTAKKKVQLFSGLEIYSGIYNVHRKSPGRQTIVFYALCLLYFLSTGTIVSDSLAYIFQVSNNSICKNVIFLSVIQLHLRTLPVQLQSDSQPLLFRIKIVQTTTNGCDFIAQCTLVRTNHCTYHPFYSPKSPLSIWLASKGAKIIENGEVFFISSSS